MMGAIYIALSDKVADMGIEASYRISGSRTKMFMKCYVSHTISLRYIPQIYTSQKQGPETSNR